MMVFVTGAASSIVSPEEFEDSTLYKDWLAGFKEGWQVQRVYVSSALKRDEACYADIRMAFIEVIATDPSGHRHEISAFLRGKTVEILPVLAPWFGREYVVLVEQARIPVGRMVVSTPAGTVESESFDIAAVRELAEEVGEDLKVGKPVWLNEYISGSDEPMLVSPGGTDEEVLFCTVRIRVRRAYLRKLKGRVAGKASEGERTIVHVVRMRRARRYIASFGKPSVKTVLLLIGYELYREGSVRSLDG